MKILPLVTAVLWILGMISMFAFPSWTVLLLSFPAGVGGGNAIHTLLSSK